MPIGILDLSGKLGYASQDKLRQHTGILVWSWAWGYCGRFSIIFEQVPKVNESLSQTESFLSFSGCWWSLRQSATFLHISVTGFMMIRLKFCLNHYHHTSTIVKEDGVFPCTMVIRQSASVFICMLFLSNLTELAISISETNHKKAVISTPVNKSAS